MAAAALVINTLPAGPRKVGGGLDDPTSTAGAPSRQVRRRDHHPRPSRPTPALAPVPVAVEPEPVLEVAAPVVEVVAEAPAVVDVDELEAVRVALAALVPAAPSGDVLGLVRHVGHKLAGHGAHCAITLHPPAGSLGVDEVRARCLALLTTLRPVERQAVLALLAADLDEGADRG